MAGSAALTVAAALLGCGEVREQPDFTIHGIGVVVRSGAAFAQAPDLAARIESTIAATLDYWGGDWASLRGATLYLEGSRYVACAGASGAVGCYDGDIRVSTQDAGLPVPCVEATALVHEVGHAAVGDRAHRDPRWLDFEQVARVLGGRPGYAAGEGAACALAPGVWRHPPDLR